MYKNNNRLQAAQQFVDECIWGDYSLSPKDIIENLDSKKYGFESFLFSKIVENAKHPSSLLKALLPKARILELLDTYQGQGAGRSQKRIRLIKANLTGNFDLVPECAWRR
jgi:hypothetical protein